MTGHRAFSFKISMLSSWLNALTMSGAGRLHGGLADPSVSRQAIDLATQRRRGAELLWNAGYVADGLRLGREGLAATLEAASSLAPASAVDAERGSDEEDRPSWRAGLERCAPARAGTWHDEVQSIAEWPRFGLDAEVDDETRARFAGLINLQMQICHSIRGATLGPGQVRTGRWLRGTGLGLALLALVGLVVHLAMRPPRNAYRASNHFDRAPQFAPRNAFDGDPGTEWLLPNRKRGWIEVKLAKPARLAKVRLLNSHNPPYQDRATRNYRVQAFLADGAVEERSGKFEEFTDAPTWEVLDFAGSGPIARVRVDVLGFYKRGGGLSEIELVPAR